MRIMASFVLALLLTVVWSVAALSQSQARYCSEHDALEAEDAVQGLSSWKDVHKAFKRYGHCDDGAIGEGYSESVVHLLSAHWGQLDDLNKISSSDKKFLAFVIRHIDATTDESELKSVLANSKTQCSKSAKALCLMIEKAAKAALSEMQTE